MQNVNEFRTENTRCITQKLVPHEPCPLMYRSLGTNANDGCAKQSNNKCPMDIGCQPTKGSRPERGISVGRGRPSVLIGKWQIQFQVIFIIIWTLSTDSPPCLPPDASFVISISKLWLSFEHEQYVMILFPYQHSFQTTVV